MAVHLAYIIPLRNDLDGMNAQITDLQPNESQKNLIYDGAGQSGYLKWSCDHPGATTVDGDSWAGGSTNTLTPSALVAADTTGGGNDVGIPGVAQFGLAAYLRERIDAGAAGAPLLVVDAVTMAADIMTAVATGTAPTAVNIDAVLDAVVAGTGLALGLSFGTVEEILQIIQGQVYRVRQQTIITDNTLGVFLDLASRQAFITAQTPAQNITQGTFYAQGGFLVRGEPGFRDQRTLVLSGSVRGSAGEGILAGFKGLMDWYNPNFAYTAGTVTTFKPRAYQLDGTPVAPNGRARAVVVCDDAGNFL